MNIPIFKITILCGVLLLPGFFAQGQNTTLVKTLNQHFKVKSNVSFEINNKYGDIIVNGWDKNEFDVKIKLTTYGKTDDDTRKLMDRVEFDFNVADEFVIIETIMDRNKGLLSEFFSSIGDYSKTLMNKNELDIDFEIWLPRTASVDLVNKFGDVVINDIYGKISVEQAHGNFKSNDITNLARINVNYGNIRINSFKSGSISIKGGELELQQAEKVKVDSRQSQLYLKKINNLTLESTSDRIRISEVFTISGTASFSNFDIYRLTGSCNIDQSYGELILHSVHPGFSTINLVGKSTDYNISLPPGQSIDLDLRAREDRLLFKEKPHDFSKTYTDEKEKTVHVTGYYGKNPSPVSKLTLNSTSGEVSVNFSID